MAWDIAGCNVCGSHRCPHTIPELARLRERCDSLAVENRMMRIGIEEGAFDEIGNCMYCGDTGDEPERHATHCPVGAAMFAPHTAREVERVRLLQAVAEATSQIPDHVWAYPQMDALRAALDKVSQEGQ